ncbi:ATP-grasp domain-containing protein [Sediminibacterium sp.]|uniref:ATP-grasp domain-containing protein n=1 Tax=Sediminibacterium sp. TaxID=1917865 RepID=UPI003F6F9829
MIKQGVKRFYRLIIALSRTPFADYFKKYEKNSVNVVWIMGFSIRYVFTTSVLWDLASICALIKSGKTYSLCINKNIRGIRGKNIYYTLHSKYNIFGFDNYVSIFEYLLKEISENDNRLFPSLSQSRFWENKAFMHRKFDEVGIPTPKTLIVTKRFLETNEIDFDFPFIIKLIHSYESKGIFKIKSSIDLNNFLASMLNVNEEFLIQEILNMRKDIRVIFVNNRIELFYWRINNSNEWRPTATSKGNSVDFHTFPEFHRKTIENYSKKLGLSIGAFDIAWQDDDLKTTPIVLEVSPVFSPNPKTDNNYYLENYGEFKKKISFSGYDYLYVKEIFRLKYIHILNLFNNEK